MKTLLFAFLFVSGIALAQGPGAPPRVRALPGGCALGDIVSLLNTDVNGNPPGLYITTAVGPPCTWQAVSGVTTPFAGVPTGTCTSTQLAVNTTNGNLYSCNAGTWALTGGGGSTAFGSITSGTNTNLLVQGSAGAHTPIGTGQISATSNWYPKAEGTIYPNQPTLAFTVGGGAIGNTTVYVRVTYVGPAIIIPSYENRISTTGCTANCFVTVTMPTTCTAGNLPAGVTGCTVWDSSAGINQEQQQTASNACVNITTATCVVNTTGTGAALTYPADGSVNPPNAQTNTCPDGINPTGWLQKGDGNYYPFFGIDDTSMNHKAPSGIFTFCDSVFWNDTPAAPVIQNALVSIHHEPGKEQNVGCPGCADFGFGVESVDTASSPTFQFQQSLAQYNEKQLLNPNLSCNAASAESCMAGMRAIFGDSRTSGTIAVTGLGLDGGAFVSFNNMNGSAHGTTTATSGIGYVGVAGLAVDNTSAPAINEGGIEYVGGNFQASTAQVGTNSLGVDVLATYGGPFANGNRGLDVEGFGIVRNIDYAIFGSGGNFWFGGDGVLYGDTLITNHGNISVTGSISDLGDLKATSITPNATIGPVNPQGTSGATTWTYNGACEMADGTVSVYTTPRSTTTGNANLTGTNFNNMVSGPPNGCVAVDWYRTFAGGTCNSGACGTGWIGRSVIALSPAIANLPPVQVLSFNDTGIVATGGTTAPAGNFNNTGTVLAGGYLQSTLNTVRVGPSGFTTANNANLQTITGLSWSVYNTSALNVSFACDLAYSQGTANAAVAFGIQAASNNPTNIFATGTEQITVGPPATFVTGTLPTLATTTATNIVSGTPTATATNYTVHLGGTIELAAQTYDVINIMVSTAAGADAVTVLRGSMCYQTP